MITINPLRAMQIVLGLSPLVPPSCSPVISPLLLRGGTIIAFNHSSESLEIIRNGAIYIEGDRVVALYKSVTDITIPSGTESIDLEGKIIAPGFINTHNHGWLSPFRTIASNTTLAEYIVRYGEFSPANTLFTPEDVYAGMMQGFHESLNAGVTTIVEHASSTFSRDTSEAGLQASIDSEMRVFYAFAFHDIGKENYTVQHQMDQWESIAKSNVLDGTMVELSIAFDGFSTAPQSEINATIAIARNFNVSLVTAHCIGGPYSLYNSPELLDSLGFLNTTIPIILSHASFLTPLGASLLRSTNQYVSTCPESESLSGVTHPHAENFQDQTALGADGQSGWSADMVAQARLWLSTMRERVYEKVNAEFKVPVNTAMSVNQAFLLATRHGGLALKRNDLGVIAVGAKADLLIFDGDSPGMLGWLDPIEAVIAHSNVGDVEHVIVGGKFVKRDGKMIGSKWQNVRREFIKSARKIQNLWKDIPYPVLQGLFLGAGEYTQIESIDSLRGPGNGVGEPNLN